MIFNTNFEYFYYLERLVIYDVFLQVKNLAEIPICEEGESSPEGYASPSNSHGLHRQSSTEIAQKRGRVSIIYICT